MYVQTAKKRTKRSKNTITHYQMLSLSNVYNHFVRFVFNIQEYCIIFATK